MGPLRRGRSAARHASDAEDLLCPLCLELPASDVHCCTNGHKFCADCLGQHRESGYAGSAKCPSCRVALGDGTPLRNRDAERRIALLPGACDGCGLGMLRKDLAAHTAACPDVRVECPFPGCKWEGARRDLAAHTEASREAHLSIALGQQKRLLAAERILASVSVDVVVELFPASAAEEDWQGSSGRAVHRKHIGCSLMQPVVAQNGFARFCAEHEVVLPDCAVSMLIHREDGLARLSSLEDLSKSLLDLGVDNSTVMVGVRIAAPNVRYPAVVAELTLKVVTQDLTEIFFKCKFDTKLSKLMDAFCQRQGVARSAAIFVFDGEPLAANMAPKDYEMEDGDVIDVVTPGHPEYAQQLARLTAMGLGTDGPPDQAGASIFTQAVAAGAVGGGEQAVIEWRDRRAAEAARAGSASDTRRQRNPRTGRAGSSSRSRRSR
mmetsp:Transcript_9006/g.28481  ORF Transcript_9006/g.28481 Transcript_9006/m.28481 type:complete len:436 (+) Transcript_9006:41-1348(+)